MFYLGTTILLSPILITIIVFSVAKCSSGVDKSLKSNKKDSVKIVTKTVTIHDTIIRIVEKPKKSKKKTDDTSSTVTKKETINIEKKDSL